MTQHDAAAQPENTENECHLNPEWSLDGHIAAFNEHLERLNEAESKLHNLQAARDRAQQKTREYTRRWDSIMAGGDGTVSVEAEELDIAITQATGQAARLVPLIEAQAVEVLRLRIPARKAARELKESHRHQAADAASVVLDDLLDVTLPRLIAQPLRQVVGLYQLAGLGSGDVRRKITDAVEALIKGDYTDMAQATIDQNTDASHALATFPANLPVQVEKALRYAPSPVQESMMQHNPEFELRLALGQEKMNNINCY